MFKITYWIKKLAENIRLLDLLINEWKLKGIKGYKRMSKDGLLSILNTAKQIKNKRKSLFKSKRNKSRKSLYKPTGKSLFK